MLSFCLFIGTSGSESESESSESDEPEVETALPIKILTEQEMNQLGAKIVKAEILGDTVCCHNKIFSL